MSIKEHITAIIKKLAIPAHFKGYHYIRRGIEHIIEDPKHSIYMMGLYYTLAEEFEVTAGSVERNIRSAIATSWEHADEQTIKDIFGHYIMDHIPTNAEFLATIADYMVLKIER